MIEILRPLGDWKMSVVVGYDIEDLRIGHD